MIVLLLVFKFSKSIPFVFSSFRRAFVKGIQCEASSACNSQSGCLSSMVLEAFYISGQEVDNLPIDR